jgi:uncharacterized protein YfaQ (DUF2300 family)
MSEQLNNISDLSTELPLSEPQPQTIESQPLTIESQPLTIESQPLTIESQPLTIESQPQTIESQPQTIESQPLTIESQPQTIESQPLSEPPTVASDEVTLKINKDTLISLAQNLNTNLLVSISAYKNVLSKLKEITSEPKLDTDLQTLNDLEKGASELMNNVQTNLGVDSEKMIDPTKVIEESTGSSSFMTKLFGAEAAAILGSMMAATVLLGGTKRKKHTRRKHVRKQKKTKRAPKI